MGGAALMAVVKHVLCVWGWVAAHKGLGRAELCESHVS